MIHSLRVLLSFVGMGCVIGICGTNVRCEESAVMTPSQLMDRVSYDVFKAREHFKTLGSVQIKGVVRSAEPNADKIRVQLLGPMNYGENVMAAINFVFDVDDSAAKELRPGEMVIMEGRPISNGFDIIFFYAGKLIKRFPLDEPGKARVEQLKTAAEAIEELSMREGLVRHYGNVLKLKLTRSKCVTASGRILPEVLDELRNLKGLDQIHFNCQFGPPLSDAGLAEVPSDLPITELNIRLDETATADAFKYIARWKKLVALAIARKGESFTDAELAPLINLPLVNFKASDAPYGDEALKHIAAMKSLHFVELARTKVTGAGVALLAGLPGLPNLKSLDLQGTKITDDTLQHLGKMKTLRVLHLGKCGITDAGLAHLDELTELEILSLDLNDVTDKGISHLAKLPSLTTVYLNGTKVTDAGLEHLAKMKTLKRVYLTREKEKRRTTEEGEKRLKDALPSVTIRHSSVGKIPNFFN